jgi:uncharacterized protein involved in exopolysaccharide biosynthesis
LQFVDITKAIEDMMTQLADSKGSTNGSAHEAEYYEQDEGISLVEWGTLLLQWRKFIVGSAFVFGVVGLASGLLSTRMYKSNVTFLPQGNTESASAISLAASQFGFQLPGGSTGDWWPAVYVEVLNSRALLEPIARETFAVAEEHGRRASLPDLLEIKGKSEDERVAQTILRLREIIRAGEDNKIAAVKFDVATKWPSLSLALAQRLVAGVNQFNLESRKSSATAEREFVDKQVAEAERNLRAAENRLQSFLQSNRTIAGSPQLLFQQDRLQKEIGLRQDVYTTLSHNAEQARIREVRNTPVITVLEDPRLAIIGEPRGSVIRALVGGLAGALIGLLIAFASSAMKRARGSEDERTQQFVSLIDQTTPRFVRALIP